MTSFSTSKKITWIATIKLKLEVEGSFEHQYDVCPENTTCMYDYIAV